MKTTRTQSLLAAALVALALTGCTHLRPKTVAVDRFDYSTAISFPAGMPLHTGLAFLTRFVNLSVA